MKRAKKKQVGRKHWVYAQSHPDVATESPYNQPCDDNTQDAFDRIYNNLNVLSPREGETILLLWEGKTQREVAEMMGLSTGTISRFLQRARKKLKKFVM